MSQKRQRRCLHCKELYRPDARTRDRQRYCSAPECKRASKAQAQARWRGKSANRDYFSGPDQVDRVRQWRKANPGYWRGTPLREEALQDDCITQVSEGQPDMLNLAANVLQDDLSPQVLVLLGLISHLTGSALQEDMAGLLRKYQTRGLDVLGKTYRATGAGPGAQTRTERSHERKTNPPPRAPAPSAAAVQLARSPSGP